MMIATWMEKGNETRVAITPQAVKNYIKAGFTVAIEKGAGVQAGFSDQQYEQAGAQIISGKKTLLKQSTVLLCINQPEAKDLDGLAAGSWVISHLDNEPESELSKTCKEKQINLFSMNLIPRITRAQSMDSLSSQANWQATVR